MKILCLLLLVHTSLQLQCDKREIRAHIGGEFIIVCRYESKFLFSNKYWCRGPSRYSCDILRDTDGVAKPKNKNRLSIFDLPRHVKLMVKVTNLQIEDSDVYWIGIEKINADIIMSVKVTVTQVPVSKPKLWPLTPLADGATCMGKPLTVRCGGAMGTNVFYAWYQHVHQKGFLLLSSSDLSLHCGMLTEDSEYYCSASNSISNAQSDALSVKIFLPDNSSCIYVANIPGQPVYDCADRMRTTVAETSPTTICLETTKITTDTSKQSLQVNQTAIDVFFSSTWTGVPVWYELLRWGSMTILIICLCIFISCTKTSHKKHGRRRKKFNLG